MITNMDCKNQNGTSTAEEKIEKEQESVQPCEQDEICITSKEVNNSLSVVPVDENGRGPKDKDVKVITERVVNTSYHFTEDEDLCLRRGLKKYGWGNWLKILGWRNYRFHPLKSGESLMLRATALNLKRKSQRASQK